MILLPLLSLALADEGMWLPEQIPGMAGQLRNGGLALDPAAIASPMRDPLSAVVSLGHCSAAFVSPDGLLATAGHCVADYLEQASDAQHNYVRDGFLATNRRDEAWAGPAARIYVTEKIEDVTQKMQAKLTAKVADADRMDVIERAQSELVATCEKQAHRRCSVVSLYDGREWRLVTRLEIKDVRVVWAPPESVYAFGGDEDNWMWPRQCGDFALLRAWGAVDGAPDAHTEENVPLSTQNWLRVQPNGASAGDFVMLAGYPSGTSRWRTAYEARHAAEVRYPYGRDLLGELIAAVRDRVRADPTAGPKLQQTLFRYTNTHKNYEGMIDNFARAGLVARKEALEQELDRWVAADARRVRQYAVPLQTLRYEIQTDLSTWRRDRLVSGLNASGKLLGAAWTAYRVATEKQFPDVDRDPGFQARDVPEIRDRFIALERTLDLPSDRALLRVIVQKSQQLPSEQRIPPLDALVASTGSVELAVDQLYGSSALAKTDARTKLLEQSRVDFERSADPWIKLAVALEAWHRDVRAQERLRRGTLARLRPTWMEALQAFRDGEIYPDANGTLRLSFGKVVGYSPEDGVTYHPQTFLTGMVRKRGIAPFDAPLKVVDASRLARASRWADAAGRDVPVNFLSSLDNTGGSSGSPTLNANGELVGIVFDRNWDAVAADWVYDAGSTRSIHVDIRYMLWMLDEVVEARVLLQEMGVVRPGG